MNTKRYCLYTSAQSWEQAGICGDGTLGAMVMGNMNDETIVLSHEAMTAPVGPFELPPPMGEHIAGLRKLIDQRRFQEAEDYPMKLGGTYFTLDNVQWHNPIFPVCEIHIKTITSGDMSGYQRTGDFESGTLTVCYKDEENAYCREVFVSRADHAGVLRLLSEGETDYEISLTQRIDPDAGSESARRLGYSALEEACTSGIEDGLLYNCGFEGMSCKHGCAIIVKKCDGSLKWEKSVLRIESVRECVFAFALFPDTSVIENELTRLRQLPADYAKLFERQMFTHGELMRRVSLHLGNTDLEARFNAGRFEMLSGCGTYPPRLQGIWTAIFAVPWGSDFTNDGNIESAILGLLPSGMFEAMRSLLIGYYEARIEDFRYNARRLYGCRGIHIPAHSGDTGIEIHYNTPFQLLFWTGGAGWIAHFFYDYWLYTQDEKFFREHALPFMKEAALFYEDFLFEDGSGKLVFNPSYSPENNPGNSWSQTCVNSTMDVAIARELLQNLIAGCVTLGICEEKLDVWRCMLKRLPDYRINEDGAFCEWLADDYPDRYDHRHASHLYPVYYDLPKEFEENPEWMRACRSAYQLRQERRIQEKGTMAFGYVQCGMAAAHLGDSETLQEIIDLLAHSYYYPTLSTSHDAGPKLFNADLSGGMPALIAEAIAQCQAVHGENGEIKGYKLRLLPALPENMWDGEIKGLRLRGNMALDMRWKEGNVLEYEISNPGNHCIDIEMGPVADWRQQ